jgi:hypothetical protein
VAGFLDSGCVARPRRHRALERSSVNAPPTAIREVEAKKAVPLVSAAMTCMSTMRLSRVSIRRIHSSR